MINEISLDELARLIGLATAPAFLLGATAALVALLVGRQSSILLRLEQLHAEAPIQSPRTAIPPIDTKRAQWRLLLTRIGLHAALLSSVCTASVVNVMFVDALFSFHNNRYIIVLFALSLISFIASLVCLGFETSGEARPWSSRGGA